MYQIRKQVYVNYFTEQIPLLFGKALIDENFQS